VIFIKGDFYLMNLSAAEKQEEFLDARKIPKWLLK
jgi:hypothetical protein